MSEYQEWSVRHYLALLAGDEALLSRLSVDGAYVLRTPFTYPGRGTLLLYLECAGGRVRISEKGGLLAYLQSQGMDPGVDVVISKTVWHGVQDASARLGNGQVYLECTPEEAPSSLAAFSQVLIEVIGFRHCKYKDALVKLERGRGFDDPLAPPVR